MINSVWIVSAENLYYLLMNYNCTISHNNRNTEEINRQKKSTVALNKQTNKIYFQVLYPLCSTDIRTRIRTSLSLHIPPC
jgi:hypothetical protein